jgi:hypothetical protein
MHGIRRSAELCAHHPNGGHAACAKRASIVVRDRILSV